MDSYKIFMDNADSDFYFLSSLYDKNKNNKNLSVKDLKDMIKDIEKFNKYLSYFEIKTVADFWYYLKIFVFGKYCISL